MLWVILPYLWLTMMVALVGVTVVFAFKEKKQRAEAAQNMAPPPMEDTDMDDFGDEAMGDDGFGEAADFTEEDEEVASLDEDAFK